jgi:hypothetical protein
VNEVALAGTVFVWPLTLSVSTRPEPV